MSAVLGWIRSNVFILVFVILMIAALTALPIVSKNLGKKVREDIEARARKVSELTQLEKTQFTPPAAGAAGTPEAILVNQRLLDRYEQVTGILREDADKVRAAALSHNRQERTVLLDSLFPAPPPAMAEVLPSRFAERLLEAHERLLEEIDAGMPPSQSEMRALLERRRAQFVTQMAAKESLDALTPEERKLVEEELTKERLSRYSEAAEKIGVYASIEDLGVPYFDLTRPPSLGELFSWQWRFWICQDILRAVHAANQADGSVLRAPIKRLLWLDIVDVPSAGASAAPSGGRAGFGGRAGPGGGRPAPPAAGGAAAGGGNPNPNTKTPVDYGVSFTGRKTNPLYDVIEARVGLIVDTKRLPEVLDAFARQNFMTVLDLNVKPTAPHEAAQRGFFYGPTPVATVELTLETVWLREWMIPFMPDDLKTALGIPLPNAETQTPQT